MRKRTPPRRAEILQINEGLAGEALRTLGVAGRWLSGDALAAHTDRPDESMAGVELSLPSLRVELVLRGAPAGAEAGEGDRVTRVDREDRLEIP